SKLEVELNKRLEWEHDNISLEKDLKIHKDTVSEHKKNSTSLRKELTFKSHELHKGSHYKIRQLSSMSMYSKKPINIRIND
ncbi:hypothetical protein VP01_14083g2, partial [Puccinia sorghi]